MRETENKKRSLIKEEAKRSDVANCVRKRLEAEIYYDGPGEEGKGNGRRIIQPVALGLTKGTMAPVVRAFQPMGDSKTVGEGKWKMFRLDRIKSWKTLWHNRFKEPPGAYFDSAGRFNPDGDGSMSQVDVISDFQQKKMRNNALMDFNRKRKEAKEKENPYYALQQNISNSKMATDNVMNNVNDWNLQNANWKDDYERAEAEREAQELSQYKGNYDSASEMAYTEDFGDGTYAETSGPQLKYADDAPVQNPQNMNYDNVMSNGPVYKKPEQAPKKQQQQQGQPSMNYVDDEEEPDTENQQQQ